MKKLNIYAVYKGDKFIDVGTAEEIAKNLGLKDKKRVYWYATANEWKNKNKQLEIFKLEE